MFDSLSNNLQKVSGAPSRPPLFASYLGLITFEADARICLRQAWSKLKSENELNANNIKEPLKEIRRALLVRSNKSPKKYADANY